MEIKERIHLGEIRLLFSEGSIDKRLRTLPGGTGFVCSPAHSRWWFNNIKNRKLQCISPPDSAKLSASNGSLFFADSANGSNRWAACARIASQKRRPGAANDCLGPSQAKCKCVCNSSSFIVHTDPFRDGTCAASGRTKCAV